MSAEPKVVLVADDNEDILALVTFRLERAGYSVIQAGNGEEALRMAIEHRPNLAIRDLMMPRLDGYEVTKGIRADTEVADMPFVLAFATPAARVAQLHEPALTWRCPHQVMRLVLSEVLDRVRRAGDVSAAIHAAELRLALPLDRRSRLAMRAELAGVRAVLN